MFRSPLCASSINLQAKYLWRTISIAMMAIAAAQPALGGPPENITPGEMARIPEYCPDTQVFTRAGGPWKPTPAQRHWVALMGQPDNSPFWGLHHYCWALIAANRATEPGVSANERRYLYTRAIDDTQFVIKLATPEFKLLPELHLRVGTYHAALGDVGRALASLNTARQLKPDYWPAFLEIADIQSKAGRRSEAIKTIKAGLEQAPDEPRLTAALGHLTSVPAAQGEKRPASR